MRFELRDNEIELNNGIANDISRIEDRSALFERLKSVQYWVEANVFEIDTLFNNHSAYAGREFVSPFYRDRKKVSWNRDAIETSHSFPIGYIKGDRDLVVWVKFHIVTMNGKQVCFYRPTGGRVDYYLIEQWLSYFFGDVYTNHHCDAANFDQCLREVTKC